MDEDIIWFPRKEASSPRKVIYRKECPNEFKEFEGCMERTGNNLTECSTQNAALESCGGEAFRRVNASSTPYNYS